MADELLLVTGGSGYIASWVVHFALERGFRVRATVRRDVPGKTKHLRALPHAAERLEIVELDLVKSNAAQFEAAVRGATLVAHTASPFIIAGVSEEDLIKPAVEGTLSVLRAVASPAGASVRKVVVTSSVASVHAGYSHDEEAAHGPFGESDWSKVESAAPYPKSKTLAEKAAWDFWRSLGATPSWSLCTINPSFVQGPSITPDVGTSVDVIRRLMNREMPMVPPIPFSCVDVRDVAEAHLRALALPREATEGRRFIVAHDTLFFQDMGAILKAEFAPMGYAPPTTVMPKLIAYPASLFVPVLRPLLASWGSKGATYDVAPSRDVLGITYRDSAETIRLAGYSAVFHGIAHKTAAFEAKWVPPGQQASSS